MKRLALLIIAGIIVGKILVNGLVSLSQSTQSHVGHLSFDKSLDEYKRLGPIPDEKPLQAESAIPVAQQSLPHAVGFVSGIPRPVVAENKVVQTNPATPKEDEEKKRRKKRKKKLEEKTAENPQKQAAPPVIAAHEQSPANTNFGGPLVSDPTAQNLQNPGSSTTPYGFGGRGVPPININNWQDALVHRPTVALMRAFMTAYQKKQISDAQFYQVLGAMDKSPLLTSRQFAVQAAQLQTRFESFVVLSDVAQTETDSQLKGLSTTAVQTYSNVSELPILSEALVGSDGYAKIEAAQLLKNIVSGLASSKNIGLAQSLLSPFIPILTQMSQQPGLPADLQLLASADLQAISSLLGIAST